MKLRLFLASCLLAGAVVLPVKEAWADSPVRKIPSNQAQGLNGTLPTITVWAGSGANVNFIPTGEIIKKVWLDDPSQITLDFDGPMCMLAGESGESSCEDSAATVIHLRRIHQLKFPNLPRTASTLLSVISQTSSGERKLYQFRVAYGSGVPQYHTVSIYPDSQALPAIERNTLLQVHLQDVERGLQVAKSRNLLGRSQGNQRLELRVQNFLALVSSGTTVQSAALQAGVSMALVSKLAELGATKPLTPVRSTPISNRVPVITSDTGRQSPTSTNSTREPMPSSPSSSDAMAAPSLKKQPEQPPRDDPGTKRTPSWVDCWGKTVDCVVPGCPLCTEELQPGSVTSPSRSIPRKQTAIASRSQQPLTIASPPAAVPMRENVASSVLTSRPERASTTASRASTTASKWLQAIDDANAAAFGLAVAKHKGQINPNTLTWRKAQGAIRQLRLGESRESAARQAGIAMSVLSQLIEWGQNRP